jgi:hypothetical protein
VSRRKDQAERAGRAAKTAHGLRRERGRVVGWAVAVLLGLPLLFAAVWLRDAVSRELRERDELYAERERLDHSLLELSGERTRLSTWASIGKRSEKIGLRPPGASEVVWIPVERKERKGGRVL